VLDIDVSEVFSIQISDVSASDLAQILGGCLDGKTKSLLISSSKVIALTLKNVDIKELVSAVVVNA
jgi:hypothetical protein